MTALRARKLSNRELLTWHSVYSTMHGLRLQRKRVKKWKEIVEAEILRRMKVEDVAQTL